MANNPDNQNPNEANAAAGGSPDNPNVTPKPIEKLSIEKFVKTETKEFKESFKIEKNEAKEHKDHKHEKLEKNEAKEHKDSKVEKHEKNEIKEHKDAKLEKHEKLEQLEKLDKHEVQEKLIDVGPRDPGGPVEQRLANLEQTVGALNHFIQTGQRPDLSQGALTREPDKGPKGGGR
jgi:hypothetical protein